MTIVEMMDKIAAGESTTVLPLMMKDFESHGVKQYVNTKVDHIENNIVYTEDKDLSLLFSNSVLSKYLTFLQLLSNDLLVHVPQDVHCNLQSSISGFSLVLLILLLTTRGFWVIMSQELLESL